MMKEEEKDLDVRAAGQAGLTEKGGLHGLDPSVLDVDHEQSGWCALLLLPHVWQAYFVICKD